MLDFLKKSLKSTIGKPPGTLIHVGEKRIVKTKINLIQYGQDKFKEKELDSIDDLDLIKIDYKVNWINIRGIHDIKIIEKIGKLFNFHPLILEDIMNAQERSKIDYYKENLFIILRMLNFDREKIIIKSQQISIILSANLVISFQEDEQDLFNSIKERIKNKLGKIRDKKADYLAYALMDFITDNYFLLLEDFGQYIENIEDEIIENPQTETLEKIHDLRDSNILLRKSIWPLRDIFSRLARGDSPLIDENTIIYLRDVYDHSVQIIEILESFRDMISGIRDTYLSSISNRMNEIMKVLTIIATIFMPLTLIAGIYGMNFQFMPELQSPLGYPLSIVIMIIIGVMMIIYFRKKRWL
ncbi:MAG: magnesium and cobalt transport protein CorA [Candidatus Lokiarchaeota archaeon]|nr:magnesium and cobalt transport protein CorA [Candidatus Lokiarchaeota archaeon]